MNKHIFTLLISIFSISNLLAQSSSESDLKRMFVYHFIKYIDWPDNEKDNDFKIAILNDNSMHEILKNTIENSTLKGRKISISKINITDDLSDYEIVYVPKSESKHFEKLKDKSRNLNLLFITDKNGLIAKGSGINFKTQGNKLRFEMNINELAERGLKVAGRLKQVAILM